MESFSSAHRNAQDFFSQTCFSVEIMLKFPANFHLGYLFELRTRRH